MIRQEVIIKNLTGLQFQPAGVFCNMASAYPCKIMFQHGDTISNAKSMLSVLASSIQMGDIITLICDGEDEDKAMQAMVEAIEDGLGE